MNQSVYFLIVFILLAACSFDKKSGIWTGSDEEKRIFNLEKEQSQEKEIIKIFSTSNSNLKEISTEKNVILTTPYKNLSWTMSAYNLQNQIGNFYLPKADKIFLKKKIGKNKFNILKTMSSPLISGDNIVVTDDRGYIYSINKRGKTNWKRNIYKKVHKKIYKTLSLSINSENIYVSDNIGFVYSINLNSGNVNWVKNHGIPIKSSIKVFDNKIYFINQDNRILCLDAKDGSLLWGRRSISSFIKSQGFLSIAISESGELFSLTSSGELQKINSKNGNILWSLNITDMSSSISADFFKSSEIVIIGSDLVFSTSSSLFSFNTVNGYLNWKIDLSSGSTPIIDGKYIFAVSDDGYFLNVEKDTGKIIWSKNILKILKKRKRNTNISGFILGSGKAYITTLNGYLIVCSANTGNIEYFKKISKTITAPPIIAESSLYVISSESKVLGFN